MCILAAAGFAAGLPAQEAGSPSSAAIHPRTVIFPPENLGNVPGPYGDLLYKALEQEFEAEGFELIPRDAVLDNPVYKDTNPGAALSSRTGTYSEAFLPAARDLNAQTAVISLFGIQDRRLVIQIKVCHVRTGRVAAEVQDYTLEGLAGYAFAETIAGSLSPQLRAYLSAYNNYEVYSHNAVEGIVLRSWDSKWKKIFFSASDDGMTVTFGENFPGETVPGGGELRMPYVPFRAGDTIIIEKSKEGYYTTTQELPLKAGMNTFKLERPQKIYRHELSVYLYPVSFFSGISGMEDLKESETGGGAGYRYYFIPDYVFAGPDIRLYRQEIYDIDDFSDDNPRGMNLSVALNAGSYLFSRYSTPVRFAFSMGLGMNTTFVSGDSYVDFYLIPASLSMDINVRPWTIFFQGDCRLALGWGNNALHDYLDMFDNVAFIIGVRKKW
jgi:hypothetical protein